MTATVQGQCNCGRYKVIAKRPDKMNLCHCIDCRRWAGGFYSAHIFTEEGEYSLTGPPPRTHTLKGQDGRDMLRAWCDECGCGLYISPDGDDSKRFFKAGLFEPRSLPDPTFETFTKHMETWEMPVKGTERFEDNLKL